MTSFDTYWLSMAVIILGSAGMGFAIGWKKGWRGGFDACSNVWREVLDVEAEIGDDIDDGILGARRLD